MLIIGALAAITAMNTATSISKDMDRQRQQRAEAYPTDVFAPEKIEVEKCDDPLMQMIPEELIQIAKAYVKKHGLDR